MPTCHLLRASRSSTYHALELGAVVMVMVEVVVAA